MSLKPTFVIAALFLAFAAGAATAQAEVVNSCDTQRTVAFESNQTGWNPWFSPSTSKWNQEVAYRHATSYSNALMCANGDSSCYRAESDPKFPFTVLATGWNPGDDARPLNPPEPNSYDPVAFPPTTEWYSCASFCKYIEGATHCFDNGTMCYAAKLKSGSSVRVVAGTPGGSFCDNGQCWTWSPLQAGTCTPLPQPADLTAGGITPATATAGIPVSFSATVANGGGSAAGASATRFQWATSAAGAGATLIADTATAAVAAGGSQAVSAAHTFASAGTLYVRACADSGSAVAESNENNNCGPWTAVTVAQGTTAPDLTAGGITPATASLNQTRALSGTITNAGAAAAGASRGYFEVTAPNTKGNTTAVVNTPAIAISAASTASFNYTFAYAGTYAVRLCADWYGEVAESNEGNNCGPWTSISVSETPVPASVSCSVNSQSVPVGGSVTYTATPTGAATSPYSWTGSDGATGFGSGATATRTFSAPGTYGMQVSASGASSAAQCPLVSVAANWCTGTSPDLTITATPNRVRSGQTATLTWSASGVPGQNAVCTVTGPGVSWTSTVSASPSCSAGSSASVTIQTQSVYTLTCGSATETAVVNVIPNVVEF